MKIDWDDRKNTLNLAKHNISFELAQHVFDDPFHLSIQDRYENNEERWQTIGEIRGIVVILVAHTSTNTYQGESIRIISARKATKKEREYYEKNR